MTRFVMLVGMVCLAHPSGPSTAQDGKKPTPTEALRTARQDYYQAFYRGDTDTMAKFEADDFAVFHDRSPERQNGEEWRRDIRKLVADKQWNPRRMVAETVDQSIRVTESRAVVGGIGLVEASDAKDRPKEYKAFTEIWVEKDGRWRLDHLHYDFRTPEEAKPMKD